MSKKKNISLFKERITWSDYEVRINELADAIDKGSIALRKLLFGTEDPDVYADHGSYAAGGHNRCAGLSGERFTEKRLCKCMYYRNSIYRKTCDRCDYKERFDIVGGYQIADYEVPAFYYGDGIGEIDLIITGGNSYYATEVKPYKGNQETLLRMIAEIMTYTEGYPAGTYKRAIAFFEKNRENGLKTPQQKEYENADPALKALLKKADIAVFRFEETGQKGYQICRL